MILVSSEHPEQNLSQSGLRQVWLSLLLTVALSSGSAVAYTVTIDFERATTSPSGSVNNGNPYIEDGFALSTPNRGINVFEDGWQSNRGASNGTNYGNIYENFQYVADLILTRRDRRSFALRSIDVAELFQLQDYAASSNVESVAITGFLTSGNTVSAAFNLDGVIDGLGGVEDFETILFDDYWGDLTKAVFNARPIEQSRFGVYFAFDNIVVGSQVPVPPKEDPETNVPSPASIVLLGLGLIALRLMRPASE